MLTVLVYRCHTKSERWAVRIAGTFGALAAEETALEVPDTSAFEAADSSAYQKKNSLCLAELAELQACFQQDPHVAPYERKLPHRLP